MELEKKDRDYLNTFYKSYLQMVDYKELKSIYSRYYSIGSLGSSLNDKLTLISLVAVLVHAAKKKSPDADCYKVLKKILKADTCDSYLKSLCILVEDLMIGCNKFDNCGLKTSEEIINKINELYSGLLPF